jgi:ABC-type tungstate transport system permease subunit
MRSKKGLLILMALMLAASIFGCAQPETTAEETVATTDPVTIEAAEETPYATMAPGSEDKLGITILYEQDDAMINNYTLLAVNEDAPFTDLDGNAVDDVAVNTIGAKALIDWMLGDEATALIGNYGFEQYGEYLFYNKEDRPVSASEIPQATDTTKTIRLSTTTSVNDSGLMGYLLPFFESEYGYEVEVLSAGTGKAIAAAMMGNADLILVHSKTQEEPFVEAGFSKVLDGYDSERLTFMYNYFVLIGPKDDPAQCAEAPDVNDAFKRISDGKYPFVSRGDQSGTHTKEISLWPEELGITTDPTSVADYSEWYLASNAGMGVCLTMANEMDAYILSDKATFLTFRANGGIVG